MSYFLYWVERAGYSLDFADYCSVEAEALVEAVAEVGFDCSEYCLHCSVVQAGADVDDECGVDDVPPYDYGEPYTSAAH